MSLSMMKPSAGVVSRPARASTVRVMAAVPENVASARKWIDNWKGKKAAVSNRPSWFPGTTLPAHLDGSMVGDYGFDPLNLGVDSYKLKWYQQAELMNGRTAMMAVVGILFPEILHNIGLGGPAAAVPWFSSGRFSYFAPPAALFMVMMFLFAWVEIRRYMDMRNPGSVNQDPIFSNQKLPSNNTPGYPGFDPLGYSKGPQFDTYKEKELKNARLAMLAFAGFAAQAYTTGKTPLQNLSDHLSNPWATTVWQNDLNRL